MLRKLLAAACFALLASSPLYAAPANTITQQVGVCDPNYPTRCIAPDASGNMPVTGTFSATLGGFTPSASGARGTPLSVTTSDSSGTLPTGAVVAVTNVGANPMFCNVNGIAATTSDQMITASGGWFAFTIPNAITTLRCIATGGSTTANMVGGSGLPTGTGGGGGSGGGAITAAINSYAAGAFSAGAGVDGWDVTQGLKTDAACAGDNTSGCSVEARLQRIAQNITTLNATAGAPIAAGTAIIGKTGIDQTTPGTTNLVAAGQNGTWTVQPGNTPNTTPWLANPNSQYPSGATPYTASATGTTAATTATLTGAASVTTYLCSLSIRSNATAAATGNATVTGTITGTLNYNHWTAPLASGMGITEMIFTPCVPASAANTSIAVVSPAPGAGGTISVTATGYKL